MWLPLPNRYPRSHLGPSRRLEKLDDVSAAVLDQDLLSARTRDDVVSEREPVPLHGPDARLEVRDFHDEPVPPSGDGLPSVRHRPRGGAFRPAQPERGVAERYHRERFPPPFRKAEPQLRRIELHGAIDVIDQVPDHGHIRTPWVARGTERRSARRGRRWAAARARAA